MKRTLFFVCALMMIFALSVMPAFADTADAATGAASLLDSAVGIKALASAIAIGLVGSLGALAMGLAAGKAVEGISRQPEADGKIRTTFMLSMVFIETAIIYALLVVILIIFVL